MRPKLALALLSALALAGCGGSSSSSSSSSASTSSAAASASSTTGSPSLGTIGPEGILLEHGPVLAPASSTNPSGTVDGIQCAPVEQLAYHVHAHLTILDLGQPVLVPNKSGFGSSGCLYWLHTHDATGIVHIEAPSGDFRPTLGKFFDIVQKTYGQPLMPPLGAGEVMKVYVNQRPYQGSPRAITLLAHTTITIEIGPPFEAPQTYNFGSL